MADIHIGKISQTQPGKGKAQLFYHIPIDAPVGGVIPTPQSAIAASLQQAEIAAAIKADWQNAKTEYNDKYNFVYKFYGVTLDATA